MGRKVIDTMEKIKTLKKKIDCDLGSMNLSITLVKGSYGDSKYFSSYAVISETDECMSYAPLGYDYPAAESITELLFLYDVAPQSLCDVVREMQMATV